MTADLAYPHTAPLSRLEALVERLGELERRMKTLPLTEPARGKVAQDIVRLADAIEAMVE